MSEPLVLEIGVKAWLMPAKCAQGYTQLGPHCELGGLHLHLECRWDWSRSEARAQTLEVSCQVLVL